MPTTSNFGWTTPADTDLVKDGAAAIRTLGNGIDTSLVDLKGGTTNQVLAKNSNTDLDFKWVADASGIPATIFDAKGDIIAATAADTADRLAVGTNGQVLTADSTTATGLKWASPASSNISLSQVATGSVSGTTLSITGLSSYDTIFVLIDGVKNASGASTYNFGTNSATGVFSTGNIFGDRRNSAFSTSIPDPSDYATGYTDGRVYMMRWSDDNTQNNLIGCIFTNCKATGFTLYRAFANYRFDDSGTARASYGTSDGIILNSAAISSVELRSGLGYNMNGGTYYVYAG